MKTIAVAVAVFALTACASGPSPRAPIAKAKSAKPVIETPARVSGEVDLSSLDQVQVMRLLRNGTVRTDMRICVAPNGQVSKAKILSGSGEQWLEEALLASVEGWTYQPYEPTVAAQRCHTVRVDLRG